MPLFNLGWWLQHSVAAVLLFLKQPHYKIRFDLGLNKFLAALQKVCRGSGVASTKIWEEPKSLGGEEKFLIVGE